MRSEEEIRNRLEQTNIMANTSIDHLRIQRYHEGKILEWVLIDASPTKVNGEEKDV